MHTFVSLVIWMPCENGNFINDFQHCLATVYNHWPTRTVEVFISWTKDNVIAGKHWILHCLSDIEFVTDKKTHITPLNCHSIEYIRFPFFHPFTLIICISLPFSADFINVLRSLSEYTSLNHHHLLQWTKVVTQFERKNSKFKNSLEKGEEFKKQTKS